MMHFIFNERKELVLRFTHGKGPETITNPREISIPHTQIALLKYHFLLEGTRATWRNDWFQDWLRKYTR